MFERMVSLLEQVRICRHLFLSNCFLQVALTCVTIFMNILTTSSQQPGFLSIDCGSTRDNYNDSLHLEWVTDSGKYMKTGSTFEQSFVNSTFLDSTVGKTQIQALQSFRYFPERRNKHCYELPAITNVSYLIRASFYLNKDELNKRMPLHFVVFINANNWFTLKAYVHPQPDPFAYTQPQTELFVVQEAIYNSPGSVLNLCLQPLIGEPFISSLELRQLEDTMYRYTGSALQYLALIFRYNMGQQTEVVRFPDDSYDRMWEQDPQGCGDAPFVCVSNPKLPDTTTRADVNYVPPKVMEDAKLTPVQETNFTSIVSFSLYPQEQVYLPSLDYLFTIVYFEDLNLSSKPYGVSIAFELDPGTFYSDFLGSTVTPAQNVSNQASMQATPNLILPTSRFSVSFNLTSNTSRVDNMPYNAFEVYGQYNLNFSQTDEGGAITALKESFSLTDWQGDPCIPVPYDWLSCGLGWTNIFPCDSDFEPCDHEQQHFLAGVYTINGLNLSNLPTSGWRSFNVSSKSLKYLTDISITNSNINDSILQLIATNFILWSPLEKLDLSHNVIGEFPAPSAFIAGENGEAVSNLNLRSLNVSHNSLSGELDLFESYTFSYSLQDLDMSYNNISLLPYKWSLNYTYSILVVLNLSHNQLQGNISKLDGLFKMLSKSLQKLYISNNNLGGPFSADLYFSLTNLTVGIFDQNYISGTLNLSRWLKALQKAASTNTTQIAVTFQLFSFLNNNISNIVPSAEAFQSTLDVLLKDPTFTKAGILLGGNPYCKGAKSYVQRHFCRYSIYDVIKKEDKHNNIMIIIITCVGVLVALVFCITFASICRLWNQVHNLRKFQQALAYQKVQPPFYGYSNLKGATCNFHKDNKLGHGAFGIVYKGELQDRTMIAVKKLFNSQNLQVLNEFLNEVVLITGIKHKNLVQLKGCCIKDKQRLLVYEYAEKGNLAEALWGVEAEKVLSWEQLLKICIGVARGLAYLHEELQTSIVHRDIKPENILLDGNFIPKIADFGLARNFADESSQALYTHVAGTLGYFSPEYAMQGQLSEKVDVYSYGIVVLEVISGRKCIDSSLPIEERFLKDWVQNMQKRGLLHDVLPPNLRNQCVADDAIQAIHIALLCVQQDPRRRPSMSEVVTMFLGSRDVKSLLEEAPRDGISHEALLATHMDEDFYTSLKSAEREDWPLFPSGDLNLAPSSKSINAKASSRSYSIEMSSLFG